MASCNLPREWGTNKTLLNDESISCLEEFIKLGFHPLSDISMEEGRKQFTKTFNVANNPRHYEGSTKDYNVPCQDLQGGIPIRVYTPCNVETDPVLLVFFHGGGFIHGGENEAHTQNKIISSMCGFIIIDVNYRLCPENDITVALNDCAVAAQWIKDNKTKVGGTEKSIVGVSGESAGGLCTIYVTHHVPGLDFQIPIFPWCDMTNSLPSREEFAFGPVTSMSALKWMTDVIIVKPNSGDLKDPRWSPVFYSSQQVRGSPPALVITAEADACRDDGRAYAKLLIEAGVHTEVFESKGSIHGFYNFPDLFKISATEAYKKVQAFINWQKNKKNTELHESLHQDGVKI